MPQSNPPQADPEALINQYVAILRDPNTSGYQKIELVTMELLKRIAALVPLNAYAASQYVVT